MPKPPVTISIVPSSLAFGFHLGVALGVLLVSMAYALPWLSATAALCLGLVVWRYARRRNERWRLRFVEQGETGGEWQVQRRADTEWRPCSLGCEYLGPWLVGLRLAKEPLWLWPDSLSKEEGRALRRLLLAGKASTP
ncbi:protein YgfX [Onishia niordana]|uniref:protein YgfX n=1 Tax=Onishia niordana TaxID=2508711 RepID=UPI0027B98E81|nr:protein YgfX [Halomonas niordiana]